MRACSVPAWLFLACSWAPGGEPGGWWNPNGRYRTSVVRPAPYRDDARRPVEVAVDVPFLLQRAGVKGDFDPRSLRVVLRSGTGPGCLVPFARRSELNLREGRAQEYLAWLAEPVVGAAGEYDTYFETKERKNEPVSFDLAALPPENLFVNPGFEAVSDELPEGWTVTPPSLVRSGRFARTDGQRSLQIVVDETTPKDVSRTVAIAQKVDVRPYAGQEMLFECDLMAQRAEGTLTSGRYDQDPRSVHWGLQAGTLEFWCRPKWNSEDGRAHVFFEGIAYGHRVQSQFRKLGAEEGNQREFSIADASGRLRSVRGPAALRSGRWHHLAATWDFPRVATHAASRHPG